MDVINYKEGKPIDIDEMPVKKIEKQLLEFWRDNIYRPLMQIISDTINTKMKLNSISALKDAIRKNKIRYDNGNFVGNFSASTSRELIKLGAEFNKKNKTYKLPWKSVPIDIRAALTTAQTNMEKLQRQLDNQIADINKQIDQNLKNTIIDSDDLFKNLEEQLSGSLKASGIDFNKNERMLKKIQKDYTENLKTYVKDWNKEATKRLRENIKESIFKRGLRAESMVDAIEKEYNVSKNKAEFLARQESSLLLSKYREENYKQVGISKYKWSSSKDERVREDHRELDGQIFAWDTPPIVDKNTGRRAHPGEDFGCRCVAVPIIG